MSKTSAPVFVYVGYSVPKQSIHNLIAESVSSSSIRLSWDSLLLNENNSESDSIATYKIHYTPLSSMPLLSEGSNSFLDSLEEIFTTDKNEHILTDLRKFTEYQVNK